MIVKCNHCGDRFRAEIRSLKIIGYDGTHFCSKDCLLDYLSIPTDPPTGGRPVEPHWNYRSEWERGFAQFCKDNELDYRYEPYLFRLPNGKFYLPDFMVNGHMVEIKGQWESGAKKKTRLYRKVYGPLLIISENMLKLLEVLP